MHTADPVGARIRGSWWAGVAAGWLLLGTGWAIAAEQRLSRENEALLRRVDERYNHLRSLRTHFDESYDGMGLHRTESGVLLLSKPGRMRWDYAESRGKVFVMDGHYGWSYVPGDAQAQRGTAKQMDDLRSPLRLLLGHAQLRRELTGINVAALAADGSVTITGEPSSPQTGFAKLTLRVTPAGQIEDLSIVAADGASTRFVFSEMQENVLTRDADFVFTPPMGVPIVDGLPPI